MCKKYKFTKIEANLCVSLKNKNIGNNKKKTIMEFKCLLCGKQLKKKQALQYHMKAKYPCNKRCKVCNKHCKTRKDYDIHILEHKLNDMKQKKNKGSQKLQPMPSFDNEEQELMRIPIQDFDLAALKELQALGDDEIIILAEEDEYTGNNNSIGVGNLEVGQLTLTHTKKITYIRARNAKKALPMSVLQRALTNGIAPNINAGGIRTLPLGKCAQTTLESALTQPDPQMHNVHLSDMSRGTVKFFMRNEDGECCWTLQPKESAHVILDQYSRNLFWFVLEACLSQLCPVFWLTKKIYCLALEGNDSDRILLVHAGNQNQKLLSVEVNTNEVQKNINKNDPAVLQLIERVKQQQKQISDKHAPGAGIDIKDLYTMLSHAHRYTKDTMTL